MKVIYTDQSNVILEESLNFSIKEQRLAVEKAASLKDKLYNERDSVLFFYLIITCLCTAFLSLSIIRILYVPGVKSVTDISLLSFIWLLFFTKIAPLNILIVATIQVALIFLPLGTQSSQWFS